MRGGPSAPREPVVSLERRGTKAGTCGGRGEPPGRTEAPSTRTYTRVCVLITEELRAPQRGHGCPTRAPNQPATAQTRAAPGTGGQGPSAPARHLGLRLTHGGCSTLVRMDGWIPGGRGARRTVGALVPCSCRDTHWLKTTGIYPLAAREAGTATARCGQGRAPSGGPGEGAASSEPAPGGPRGPPTCGASRSLRGHGAFSPPRLCVCITESPCSRKGASHRAQGPLRSRATSSQQSLLQRPLPK